MCSRPMAYHRCLQGKERFEPEEALLAAVLWSALLDIRGEGWQAESGWFTKEHKRKWAIWWLLSDSVHCSAGKGVSFRFICEALELDAERIRAKVKSHLYIKKVFLSYETQQALALME